MFGAFFIFKNKAGVFILTYASLKQSYLEKQSYLDKHHNNVAFYARQIAGLLCPDIMDIVTQAASVHDVGKIRINDKIILKPGPLDESEWEIICQHPVIGAEIIMKNKAGMFNGNHAEIALAVLHHHERFDGDGYPERIGGEDIPIAARIIAVADAFDAMTTDRPYRKARNIEEAISELTLGAGTQFDPIVVKAFQNMFYHGSKVQWGANWSKEETILGT
jgi:HD-GYP domain-containing protein (c-di-GMP phosphodiesterase class II)